MAPRPPELRGHTWHMRGQRLGFRDPQDVCREAYPGPGCT